MAEQQTRAQKIFDRVSGNNFDVAGIPVGDIVGVVSDVLKRRPNVKAWAQAKRQEKRRLRAQGLSGNDLRVALRRWQNNNPKPQGNEPFNPMDLGTSNQLNGNAQANISSPGMTLSALPSGVVTKKAGLGFNPLFLLLLLPFVFPKQFRGLRKSLKI